MSIARIIPFAALFACAHGAPAPGPVRAYAEVNGLHMYFEIHGQGRPILLLHGGIGGLSFWSKTLPALAKEHRVIAPEQMGHGRTADLPSRQFSYPQMAEDTAALLAQLGVESVDVVGMSDGGIVGYLLAINHPSLVRRLVTSGANVDGEGLPPPKTGEVTPEQVPKMFRDDYEEPFTRWPSALRRIHQSRGGDVAQISVCGAQQAGRHPLSDADHPG